MSKFLARKTAAGLLGLDERSLAQLADDAQTVVKRSDVGPKARMYSLENVFDIAAHVRKKKHPKKLPLRVVTTNIPRGGTGKTLVATNLAVSLALMGIRTAIIDVDYQASATLLMGYDPDVNGEIASERGLPPEQAVDYHLGHLIGLGGTKTNPKAIPFDLVAKYPFGKNGPMLVPSDVSLTSLDNELFLERLQNPQSDLAISKWLANDPNMQEFEAVIFDSGPGFNRVISAALAASHMVIAPVGLERVSDKGLHILTDELQKLRDTLGVQVAMRIIANSMVSTQRCVAEFQHITTQYQGMVIPYPIRRSEDVPKSYAGTEENAPLLPFMLEYPSSEVTSALKQISSVVFNELWSEVIHAA